MTDYTPGNQVLFTAGLNTRIGTIAETNQGRTGYIIDGYDGHTWAVTTDHIVPLPTGATLFHTGDRVQVRADAPNYAGCCGRVEEPEIRDGLFGYWLRLEPTDEPAWVLAAALMPADGGAQ